MTGTLVLNVFLAASFQYLLEMVNTQQIILMLPLFNLAAPANTAIFFGFLMQIASFDLLPVEHIYDFWIEDKPDSLNSNFEAEGYETTYIIYNMGSMIIAVVSFPILVVWYFILSCCAPWQPGNIRVKCMSRKKKLKETLFFAQPLVTYTESYAVLCICALISTRFVSYLDALTEVCSSTGTTCFSRRNQLQACFSWLFK